MAKEQALTLKLGTDHAYDFHIKNAVEDTSIDVTGWALSFMVKRNIGDDDADALLTLTTASAITIAGTFNSTPSSNTQLITVTIADTDTDAIAPGLAVYELKRTDAGFETPLNYGTITLTEAVHDS